MRNTPVSLYLAQGAKGGFAASLVWRSLRKNKRKTNLDLAGDCTMLRPTAWAAGFQSFLRGRFSVFGDNLDERLMVDEGALHFLSQKRNQLDPLL